MIARGSDLLLETLRVVPQTSERELAASWRIVDTGGMRGLVEFEVAALWLHMRLKELGAFPESATNSGFWRWLAAAAKKIAAKNMLVESRTSVLLRHLRLADAPHVLIKGSARQRAAHLYPYAAARPTNDLDVLVQDSEIASLRDRLMAAGYRYAFPEEATPKGHYHLRPLADDSGVPVELHVSTASSLSPSEAWSRTASGALEIDVGGEKSRIPSATELLWHGITHGVLHEARAYRLRFFLDATSILASQSEVDWDAIDRRLDSPETNDRSHTVAWLGTAAWLAGVPLPDRVARGVKPFPLRRVMRWRLGVFRSRPLGSRVRRKLLEEGTRGEAGMPLLATVAGTTFPLRIRRRTAARAARASYLLWRLLHRD